MHSCARWILLIVGTGVLDCVEYLLFSDEEKRSKKVVGTLAAVSRTPQRFKVGAKFCCVAPPPALRKEVICTLQNEIILFK